VDKVRRIVIIEDNLDAARLIERILRAHSNVEVQIATNGAEGLNLIYQFEPDMVITDLMMPDVDGFTIINNMKADPKLTQIPIVVVTAKELTAKERKQLNEQVDMLLQKGSALDDTLVENLVHKLN